MIRVIDKELNTAIQIEVIGLPYQWRLSLGKSGTYKVKRGCDAGKEKSGLRFDFVNCTYHHSLADVLKMAQQKISLQAGLDVKDVDIEGIAGWNKAIAEENKMIALAEKVEDEFGHFIVEYGDQMRRMALDSKKNSVDTEDETEE